MPRFYWFTFFSGMGIGFMMAEMYMSKAVYVTQVFSITILSVGVLVNEKHAVFEDLLNKKARKFITIAYASLMILLWAMTL